MERFLTTIIRDIGVDGYTTDFQSVVASSNLAYRSNVAETYNLGAGLRRHVSNCSNGENVNKKQVNIGSNPNFFQQHVYLESSHNGSAPVSKTDMTVTRFTGSSPVFSATIALISFHNLRIIEGIWLDEELVLKTSKSVTNPTCGFESHTLFKNVFVKLKNLIIFVKRILNMKIINLFGGPGVGKTTVAMEVFTALNRQQHKVEYVDEYAKGLTWDKSFKVMENQRLIFANQHQQFYRLRDTIEIVVTDAPLFNSIVYSGKSDKNKTFHADVFHEFNEYKNLNFFLRRETEYKEHGRSQKLEDAIKVDLEVIRCLEWFKVPYVEIGLKNATESILSMI